jgi:acrylyl-CoA reductase (NADPH)
MFRGISVNNDAGDYRAAVTVLVQAQGMEFPATVAPFILRSVTIYGVDSVMAPRALRLEAWQRFAGDLDVEKLEGVTTETGLSGGNSGLQ